MANESRVHTWMNQCDYPSTERGGGPTQNTHGKIKNQNLENSDRNGKIDTTSRFCFNTCFQTLHHGRFLKLI